MIEVHLRSQRWRKKGCTSLQGTVFIGTEPVSLEETANRIAGVARIEDIVDKIQKWNGFFSIVIESPKTLSLAVDRIRSMPIFYGWRDDRLYVSDDATWVHEKLGSPCLDEVSCQEFRLTGFVVGPHTLSPSVFQVQAGEAVCLHYDDQKSTWSVARSKYRQFRPNPVEGRTLQDWLSLYDEVLVRCFERTLRYVNGRPIVVPLSSGYDSRLVALMLKRLGVENVATASYGHEARKSKEISARVATDIGFPWTWIEYNANAWFALRKYLDQDGLFHQSGNLASLGHIQDWPLMVALVENEIVSTEAVVVAGHAADPLAGSRVTITPEVQVSVMPTEEDFILSIFRSHYGLSIPPLTFKEMLPTLGSRILLSIGSLQNFDDWAGAFDAFNENERQAKFIVNCLRSTEHWGLDWWMPFFDEEYFAFWERVPLMYRLGELLHVSYIDRLYTSVSGRDAPARTYEPKYDPSYADKVNAKRTGRGSCITRAYQSHLMTPIRVHRQRTLRFRMYREDPMGWYRLFTEEELRSFDERGARSINAMLVQKYLDDLGWQPSS